MLSSAPVRVRLLGGALSAAAGGLSEGRGAAEGMLGGEERATCAGHNRHNSRCQHADIYIRKHLRGGTNTHWCTRTLWGQAN